MTGICAVHLGTGHLARFYINSKFVQTLYELMALTRSLSRGESASSASIALVHSKSHAGLSGATVQEHNAAPPRQTLGKTCIGYASTTDAPGPGRPAGDHPSRCSLNSPCVCTPSSTRSPLHTPVPAGGNHCYPSSGVETARHGSQCPIPQLSRGNRMPAAITPSNAPAIVCAGV